MAELNIKITTKYENAVKGANKVTESYKKLGNQMIKASQDGQGLDEAIEKYSQALSSSLINTEQTKDGMAALTAQAKILKAEMAKVGLSIGEDNELYKNMAQALEAVKSEMDAMPASTRKASTAMQDMEKSSGNAALKLLSVAKNILKFQLLMGPITGAIRGFKNTISDSIKVAAEAEQVYNKLATVFDGLAESANTAASAIAGTLGVAKSTAASALSTVGDLLQAQGMGTANSLSYASDWVKQFQDIIAFKDLNMSLEEFAQTFMSGAAGNLRNFRTFGSIVKESAVNARLAAEGLDKLTGSELELAKMVTRANMALEQQQNAAGATEREWESALSVNRRLNEAWKEYKENLGNTLNEFIKPVKSWLTEILDYTNDVTRALKEIDGGEFTVKVQQTVDEETFIKQLSSVMTGVAATNPQTGKTGNWFTSWLNSMLPSVLAQGGASMAMQMEVSEANANAKIFSAKQVRDIILATGATDNQIMAAAQMGGFTISEDVLSEARTLVGAYEDLQEAVNEVKTSLLASGEAFDTFTESIASLAHLNLRSTNLAAVGEGVNEFNYEDIMQSFGLNASNQTNTIIASALKQMGGLGVSAFMSDFDKTFGTGSEADAYAAWLSEIESLYTILYNREVQFGDVGQDTLDSVIDMWGKVNGQLKEYNDGLEQAKLDQDALATAQSIAESYRTQLSNYGLSDYEITRNELQSNIANARTGEEANLYEDALRDFNNITAKGLIDSFSGLVYAADMAKIGMTEDEKALYDLEKAYLEAAKSEALTAEDQIKLKENYEAQRDALIEYQQALKNAEKEVKTFAQQISSGLFGKYADTGWAQGIGSAIASSTGGQIVQAGMEGAATGGPWGAILGVLMAILSKTETFQEILDMAEPIVDIFDSFIRPIAPMIRYITEVLNTIVFSMLEPLFPIIKAVSAVIVAMSMPVKIIAAVIKNVYTAILNIIDKLTNWGRNQRAYESITDIIDETAETLREIMGLTFEIEKNTENNDLKLLEDLWKRGIIDSQTYYKEAGSIQGTYVPGRVEPAYPSYVSQAPSNSSVTIGTITINAPNGDINEIIRGLVRAGIPLDTSGVAIA